MKEPENKRLGPMCRCSLAFLCFGAPNSCVLVTSLVNSPVLHSPGFLTPSEALFSPTSEFFSTGLVAPDLLVGVGGRICYTQKCSGTVPGSVLMNDPERCSGDHTWCRGFKLGWRGARQAP